MKALSSIRTSSRQIFCLTAWLFCFTTWAINSLNAQTFTGEGDWKTPERWDTGNVPVDGATVVINGIAEISSNIGVDNADNPSRIIIGQETEGTLIVSGGTLSGANGGSAGIFVGAGSGGVGRMSILPGTGLRSQGGNMVVQIGDEDGGLGYVTVGGELLNYKFFRIINGTLEMLPTGINNRFNQLDAISTIEPNGTLAYVIDGDKVGTLARANAVGLNVDIFPGANLEITLEGDFQVNDSWTLMSYHTLVGEFEQGIQFTNQQGYTFDIDYGSGEDDDVILSLVSTAGRPSINTFTALPPGIAVGESTTLRWEVGAFDNLTIAPGVGSVSGATSNGAGSVDVSPTSTTTYELLLENNGASIQSSVTVVVGEAPIIEAFSASPATIVPGDSSNLEWVVAGANTVSIELNVGSVASSGTVNVTPDETTMYTLTATNGNGTTIAEVVLTVDAVLASQIMNFDAAAPGQVNGAIFDVITGASFDLKTTVVQPVSSFTTTLTTAYRLTQFGGASGGDGNSFPGGNTTYETWVRTGELDANPQVIFETGGSADGSSLLISEGFVQFLNSQNGERTHNVQVPLSGIELSDFIHIVATLDQGSGDLNLYVRGSAGGAGSSSANGALGLPNGRASLFNWTNFSAGVAGALGGIASEVPEGVTLFRGELALLNIYDRALTEEEVRTLFERVAIPDPGLIENFTASPERAASGETVTLSWNVGDVQSLILLGPNGGDVLASTQNGQGSLDVQLTQSAGYTLVAEGAEGTSTRSLLVLVDVAEGVIILNTSAGSWDEASAWADGQAPQSGKDYLVADFVASSLGVPDDFDAVFGGGSLELLGSGARLRIQNGITDSVRINDLRLSGGTIDFTDGEGFVTLEGGVTVRQDSAIDIRGAFNALTIDAGVSGSGSIQVTASPTDLEADETLIINGSNSSFSGGWTLIGGRTFASSNGSLGTGDLELINANLEVNGTVNAPDGGLILQGNSTLVLFEDATFHTLNFRQGDGTAVSVPAGSYTIANWSEVAEGLGLNGLQIDIFGGATLTIRDSAPLPTLGSVFTGEGDWFAARNWSEGVPTDGGNAIVNGFVEITRDIGSSNADNPSRIFVGDNATGVLNVTGGTLSGAHSGNNAGLFVGVGPDGNGMINISEGAALRSQGGGMVVQIGDESGGVGHVSVAGQLFNYKFFRLINGTLEMLPTGVNNSFNDVNVSTIGANGTLAYVIDGQQVGGLLRANTTGLSLEIDPQATLKVTLAGTVSEGDTWTLIDYTALGGTFSQGNAFTNEQGHTFSVDYGSGDNDLVTLTLTGLNPDATPASIGISRADGVIRVEFVGTLQSASEVSGPYMEVADAVSPYEVSADGPQQFFRATR